MMLAKQKNTAQIGFYSTFEEQLNHSHALYILANTIDWNVFEEAFKKHYSATRGKPAKPIRLMVSLLILKQVRNLSDERICGLNKIMAATRDATLKILEKKTLHDIIFASI